MGKGKRKRAERAELNKSAGELIQLPHVQKIIRKEINEALIRNTARFFDDETSSILWVLHEVYGFGAERLKRFYTRYAKEAESLKQYYEASDDEMPYLTRAKLKAIGVDLEQWEKET